MIVKRPQLWTRGRPPDGVTPNQVVVCGTRDFEDEDRFQEEMDRFLYWLDPVTIVVGGDGHRFERGGYWVYAGADYYANKYATCNWMTRKIFRADWYGKALAAGPIRNRQMAKSVSPNGWCIAFWDGESRGTKNMISEFLRYNSLKRLRIVSY